MSTDPVKEYEEPAFILGRALAAWANQPAINTAAEREYAAVSYQKFIEDTCGYWDLTVVRMGVAEEVSE